MIPHTDWEPTTADIVWQKNALQLLEDNATWAVPCNFSVFKIDKVAKTFELVIGPPEDETNRRVAVVFKKLGYREAGAHVNRVKDFF